ncbi:MULTISPECIES: hypothetical protein [unclassified Shewanella]|uniref:hypothetical protein n=1 Tax=Shewanella TaxID=22 RepID=UPI0021DA2C0C|nr:MULTISPECIES: hypothetical protein [unclassified Shewanella]MCU8023922.1 hypothetical protein [Shewanella sp. SM78]MCU8045084.1 hypothetical protein [Shewanella sp. SM68]MCU8049370.1 hypothetical protein [Shewanella sp. SM65]MCU8080991.1 hypothetical protein [Shewanella sp. SM103]
MQKIVELSKVDLNASREEVIQYLLPVLIFSPANINVWAVYERSSYKNRNGPYLDREDSMSRKVARERLKRSESFSVASFIPKTEYLRLGSDDLTVLIKTESLI